MQGASESQIQVCGSQNLSHRLENQWICGEIFSMLVSKSNLLGWKIKCFGRSVCRRVVAAVGCSIPQWGGWCWAARPCCTARGTGVMTCCCGVVIDSRSLGRRRLTVVVAAAAVGKNNWRQGRRWSSVLIKVNAVQQRSGGNASALNCVRLSFCYQKNANNWTLSRMVSSLL